MDSFTSNHAFALLMLGAQSLSASQVGPVLEQRDTGIIYQQEAFVKASNPDAADAFGTAVAGAGNLVIIGAPKEGSPATGVNGNQSSDSALNAGAAYVFEVVGATWGQVAYLKASNTEAGDEFGSAVAVSGDTVVVGAPQEDGTNNSASASGAVYVFIRNGTTWTQQAYLKASNFGAADHFGASVAIDGDTLIVGAPDEDSSANTINGNEANNSASAAGAVYVFVRSGTSWTQQAYLKPTNAGLTDAFGGAVAISGDRVVVGAVGEDSNAVGVNGDGSNSSAANSGAAYVFVRSGTTWSQEAYLKSSNTGTDDAFGGAVSISSDSIIVGGDGEDSELGGSPSSSAASNSGAAYVFTRSETGWAQQAMLKASNAEAGDRFGGMVSIAQDVIVVGAENEDSSATGVNGSSELNNFASAGAAYVFSRNAGIWTQDAYLKASNTGPNDLFASSVGIAGSRIIVSARSEDSVASGINASPTAQAQDTASGAGAAYIFNPAALSPFQAWRKRYFDVTASVGAAGNLADPDGDGMSNLIEYAFGQNPVIPSANFMPIGEVSGGFYTLAFDTPAGVAGITYRAEWSATLETGDWGDVADIGPLNGFDHVFRVPSAATHPRFIRLLISEP